MCDKCDLGIVEDTRHIVMQCPFFEHDKMNMLKEMEEVESYEISNLLNEHGRLFLYLMGKHPDNVSFESMYIFWSISAKHISVIYKKAIIDR